MDSIYNHKMIQVNDLVDDEFLNAKELYLHQFNSLPNIHFINGIDGEKTFETIKEKYGHLFMHQLEYRWYKRKKKRFEFDKTLVILKNHCVLEIDVTYCELLHNGECAGFIEEIAGLASQHKQRQRRQPLEINLVVQKKYGLELKPMEIKRTRLDLDLFYEDDFVEIDAVIRKRLNKQDDKGIVLLHGKPGTGKTTYLRFLVGKIKKRVLFLSARRRRPLWPWEASRKPRR